jgi:uncharacterized membrane protein
MTKCKHVWHCLGKEERSTHRMIEPIDTVDIELFNEGLFFVAVFVCENCGLIKEKRLKDRDKLLEEEDA